MPFTSKHFGLIAGPLGFLLVLLFFKPTGLTNEGRAILASTVWIAIWWITEAIPIAVTSLLPIILFPLTNGLDIKSTTASFGHRYIFLYVGGFILAIAIEKWNLHRRIALNTIRLIGTNMVNIILGFMLATAFLSMWISNTATSVMMLPIGMAVVSQLKVKLGDSGKDHLEFGKALMLAIAYSASIGGISTLIGTPPNLVLAGVVQEMYGIEISFAQWIVFGLPISIVLLFICWQYLVKVAFSLGNRAFPGGRQAIMQELKALGPMGYEEKLILGVFVLTAIAWISRAYLIQPLLPAIDDTIIAVTSAVILFLLPVKDGSEPLIHWEDAVKLPWGILFLFGGGLALAEGFKTSGLAEWIGSQMTLLEGVGLLLIVVVIITSVNFLTEITSNLATTSMLLPILAPMALTLDIHPYFFLIAATTAASCAFMLPVATPPNAVVFGSGYLRIPEMVKAGIWMNIISIILLTIMVYWVLPLLWGFEPRPFPVDWGK